MVNVLKAFCLRPEVCIVSFMAAVTIITHCSFNGVVDCFLVIIMMMITILQMGNSTVTRVTFLSIGDTKISFINHILLFSNPSFVCC